MLSSIINKNVYHSFEAIDAYAKNQSINIKLQTNSQKLIES